MVTAILSLITTVIQAILEVFRLTKKTPAQAVASQLQADRDELDRALASGDAMAISVAFEKLRLRTLVQVPQVAGKKDLP